MGRENYCGNLLWQSCLTLLNSVSRALRDLKGRGTVVREGGLRYGGYFAKTDVVKDKNIG